MTVKKWLHMIAFALVVVGAIDLGLFGVIPADANGQGFDLIQQVLGFNPDVLNAFYILIGVSGIYLLVTHIKDCKVCEARKASSRTV